MPLAPVSQGTLLGPLLNAAATGVAGSLPGTFTYTPGPNTVLIHVNPATPLSVAFAPTDGVNYNIWDLTTGDIVYDNELGATDDAAPSTAIAGGSIIIHQPKK